MKAWSVRLKSCCYPSRHWSCVCVCVSAYTLGPQENTHTAEALHFDLQRPHLSLTHAGYYAVTPPRSNTDTPPAHTHPQGSVSVLYCTHSDLLGLICAAGSYFCFLKGQRVFLSRAVTDESGTDLSRCLCCSWCVTTCCWDWEVDEWREYLLRNLLSWRSFLVVQRKRERNK